MTAESVHGEGKVMRTAGPVSTTKHGRRSRMVALVIVGALVSAACTGGSDEVGSKKPTFQLAVVSEDPYTHVTSYHRTQGEPDTFAFGATIVSAFMVGYHPAPPGGSSNLGWSVSSDAGRTWSGGFLRGTTPSATPPGPWRRVADPSVAYDAKHGTWLILGMGSRLLGTQPDKPAQHAVFVSRSTDGAETFGEPVIVKAPNDSQFFDKSWITCDNTATSPFYGHCYAQWTDEGHDLRLHMSTSTDGGLTWDEAAVPKDTHVANGQPLVQPDGTVVVPVVACCDHRIEAFVSTDGGLSYSGNGEDHSEPFAIPDVKASDVHGRLLVAHPPIISADVDVSGKVYVVWSDCRFRAFDPHPYCGQNDIVMSTTTDGRHWSPVVRIPIDPRTSSVDHFLPAIAIDPSTSGASARIAIVYYFYPDTDCDWTTCELSVGLVSSIDGGTTWTTRHLAGPFRTAWLPPGEFGHRPGDYFSVSFVNGQAVPVFTAAAEGACRLGESASCHTWIASATTALADAGS